MKRQRTTRARHAGASGSRNRPVADELTVSELTVKITGARSGPDRVDGIGAARAGHR